MHLDGLRGVAIALVLAAHLMQKVRPFPGKSYVASLGGLGVYVFFALSGYLITGLLVREHQRAGRVSLRNFYVRRCLRIMPAFYLMIMVTLALAMLLPAVVVTERQALEASLFVANNTSAPMGWWLAHTWSLGVEEKFYLLWPLALVWLRPDRGLTFAAVAVVVEPVIRTVCFVLVPSSRATVGTMIPTHADALLWGALLALLAAQRPEVHHQVLDVIARYRLALVAAVFLPLDQLAFDRLGAAFEVPLGWTLESIAVVVLIAAMERPGGAQLAMSWRPLVALGLISYSLYLWQEIFLSGSWQHGPLASPALCVGLAIGVAYASRMLIERPTIRLGRRLTRSRPPGTAGEPA